MVDIKPDRSSNAAMLGWRDIADWWSCRKRVEWPWTFDYGCWPWRGEATVAVAEVVAGVVAKDAEHRMTGTRCSHDGSGEPVSGEERLAAFESRSCWRAAHRPYTERGKR